MSANGLYCTRVMHRADYQRVLANEARRLGAQIRLGADVVNVECNDECPSVSLATGERIEADVVVGADGLRSAVRTSVLGHAKEPEESRDLAYRITIPRTELENDPDSFIRSIVNDRTSVIWWGPNVRIFMNENLRRSLGRLLIH